MDLAEIDLTRIVPNPGNPRGIDIETQDEKLGSLKDSIGKFGVMVPVVVSKRGNKYLLIDGERRYVAARALGLTTMPAFILDPKGGLTNEQILFRMFQIHHNREQWGPIQQCKALETVFGDIAGQPDIRSIQDERARIQAITEKLVTATGIDYRTALDRVKFLRWPRDVKNDLYATPNDSYWYICEIEEKIIIPALVNYPEYFQKVPVDEVRRDLLDKLKAHSVEKSTDVRRVAPFLREAPSRTEDRKKIKNILSQLHRRREMTYAEAQEEFAKALPGYLKRDPVSPKKLHSLMRAVQNALEDFDMSTIDTAQRRAKATRDELSLAVGNLIESLDLFSRQLDGKGKNVRPD